ncbi:hypothetical protein D3C86_1647960 [compost metagenome]
MLHHADTLAAENQRLRAEIDRLRAEASQLRTDREAMAADRELLNIKIEEAQLRIQSILDKLPTASDARQLDLLGEGAPATGTDPDASGAHPAPGEHA